MTNRFKKLDLIDRVPEELWMEVRGTVQEAAIKTSPRKKKYKKVKWLSEEALQIAVKRREAKGFNTNSPNIYPSVVSSVSQCLPQDLQGKFL